MKTNSSAVIVPAPSSATNSVATNSPAAADIRDIKAPVEIPSGWFWLWCVLGALGIALATYVAWHAIELSQLTTGQTTGSGLPLELTFYPMGFGAACMTAFALNHFLRRDWRGALHDG